jgi:exosome complex protein LRP1
MESAEVVSLLDQLDDDIDELDDSLAPLLEAPLSVTSSKLPILDKAKLYVLLTYAIESMLFCSLPATILKLPHVLTYLWKAYLRLNGVKAREHPVFKELTRVKQYFSKIKAAEATSTERSVASLDKQAAARFIKAGLVGAFLGS